MVPESDGDCASAFKKAKKKAAAETWCYTNTNSATLESFDPTETISPPYTVEVRTWKHHLVKNPSLKNKNAKAPLKLGVIKTADPKDAVHLIDSITRPKMPPKYVATSLHDRDCQRLVAIVDESLRKNEITNAYSTQPAPTPILEKLKSHVRSVIQLVARGV